MKGLEFVFLAVGSVLGAFILGMFVILSEQWNLEGIHS
jgi:hypothetical protein